MATGLRYRLRRAAREMADQHQHIHEILADFDVVLADGSRDRVAELYGRYRSALEAHFALEEEVFFPALHGLQPEHGSELGALSREHEGFLAELAGLRARLADDHLGAFGRALRDLVRALELHERREEVIARSLLEPSGEDQSGSGGSRSASTSGVESSS
jgi:hypothetical protein